MVYEQNEIISKRDKKNCKKKPNRNFGDEQYNKLNGKFTRGV